jgi:squalene-associated FAD-dependent desaturase
LAYAAAGHVRQGAKVFCFFFSKKKVFLNSYLPHTHVIGGGLAGLAAALTLRDAGDGVTLYESGPACGGRCRSYFDQALGCRLDNGNHLLLSGNHAAMAYLDRVGARDSLTGPATPAIPWMDLRAGTRWTLRPNHGRIPFWLLHKSRRVPNTSPLDYLPLLKLSHARPTDTVAKSFPDGPLYRRLVAPFAVSVLNTPTSVGAARLVGAVIDETLARGGAYCAPLVPREGLSESFVDPAVAVLRAAGATIHTSTRISALTVAPDRVAALTGPHGPILLGRADRVVLAVPPWVAADLLPGLTVPDEFQAILNLHFRIDADPGEAGFWGLIGGTTEWIFVKRGIVSVTISAANRLVDRTPEDLVATVWPEVRRVLDLPERCPPWRVVKEKRATFAATPNQQLRRPSATTAWQNCTVAGDWTATGLPATIEGAIRSGVAAAHALRVVS